MAQQNARSQTMRDNKNASGLRKDRQGEAYTRQANGRKANKAPYAGRPSRTVEGAPNGNGYQMGAPQDWEIRCADLGQDDWRGYRGPNDAMRMVRIFADAIDHDNARPIGWGRAVSVEIREKGSSASVTFEVTGSIQYRYHARQTGLNS